MSVTVYPRHITVLVHMADATPMTDRVILGGLLQHTVGRSTACAPTRKRTPDEVTP